MRKLKQRMAYCSECKKCVQVHTYAKLKIDDRVFCEKGHEVHTMIYISPQRYRKLQQEKENEK